MCVKKFHSDSSRITNFMKPLDCIKILNDNINGADNSFMDLLHEIDIFDIGELEKLCESIRQIDTYDLETYIQLEYIIRQVWAHIAYHFDPEDLSEIKNLPGEYPQYVKALEDCVAEYRTALKDRMGDVFYGKY